jgi:hypothetical protein
MAASVALAVDAALTAAFSAANTGLGSQWQTNPDRISVYRALIPGVPTNRYCVVYASIGRGSSGLNGIGKDGNVRFQVTCAASAPDTNLAGDLCEWLVNATLDALVGATLTVSGWHPFVVEQDEVDTFPIPVEVVPGRDTVEQALWFTSLTDKL